MNIFYGACALKVASKMSRIYLNFSSSPHDGNWIKKIQESFALTLLKKTNSNKKRWHKKIMCVGKKNCIFYTIPLQHFVHHFKQEHFANMVTLLTQNDCAQLCNANKKTNNNKWVSFLTSNMSMTLLVWVDGRRLPLP